MSEPNVVIVPLLACPVGNETRRIAMQLARSLLAGEPCRICREPLGQRGGGTVMIGYSRDGKARAAHPVCWDGFVELLQTLSPQQLYELANEPREEADAHG